MYENLTYLPLKPDTILISSPILQPYYYALDNNAYCLNNVEFGRTCDDLCATLLAGLVGWFVWLNFGGAE